MRRSSAVTPSYLLLQNPTATAHLSRRSTPKLTEAASNDLQLTHTHKLPYMLQA